MTLTNEKVKAICEAHNNRVNDWLKENIPETFPASKYFYYTQLFEDQNFYKKGYRLLTALRKRGYNVKMDMQSNEIHCQGLI